ncbi:cupredoxin domain-containing protein [Bacillus suaedaesalsae]|uniref:Cupredoxin domain-containing protein n=1 Tax=Bacillus suaedaesalsae TaxID=2810349 RepID=A0ABS2DLX5_9BACI|nr:cupredoxin domain-containing protein [Bacillus suaedaesalsae]MBM6619458.1 cupredoxin domain-containing protein [Bacillus suaedaesalsae]
MKFIIIKRSWIITGFLMLIILISGIIYFNPTSIPVTKETLAEEHEVYSFHMVTGEFSGKTDDGKELEAYRFDPGTIVVPAGKDIKLSILGVNGKEHPFFIEGTNAKGNVKKGEETVLNLNFKKEGTYRLICTAHPDKEHNGPMIGYIIVD